MSQQTPETRHTPTESEPRPNADAEALAIAIGQALATNDRTRLGTVRPILADAVNTYRRRVVLAAAGPLTSGRPEPPLPPKEHNVMRAPTTESETVADLRDEQPVNSMHQIEEHLNMPTTERIPAIRERLDRYRAAHSRYYGGHRYSAPPNSPDGCNRDVIAMADFERHAADDLEWLLNQHGGSQ